MYPPSADTATPPRRVVRPVERLGAVIEVILCSGFPTQLLLIVVLGGLGMPIHGDEGRLNPRFVVIVSMLDAVLVIGLVFMFLRAHHESAREVLIGRVRVLREVFLGVAMIPLAFLVVLLILALALTYVPQLHNVLKNPFEEMLTTRTDAVIFAIVAMISGGLREEIQRGFIVHRFGQYLGGGAWGVAIYSALFGLGHIDQGYDAAIATGTLGAFWGVVYLKRRSIIAPVVSHAGFNLAQVIKHVALTMR